MVYLFYLKLILYYYLIFMKCDIKFNLQNLFVTNTKTKY